MLIAFLLPTTQMNVHHMRECAYMRVMTVLVTQLLVPSSQRPWGSTVFTSVFQVSRMVLQVQGKAGVYLSVLGSAILYTCVIILDVGLFINEDTTLKHVILWTGKATPESCFPG